MFSRTRLTSVTVGALTVFFYFYALSVMVAAPYYNWKYAQEHGLVEWLIWGEITPTAKALVWPYFAFRHTNPQGTVRATSPLSQHQVNEMQIISAMRAVESSLQVNYIIDSRLPGSGLTKEQVQKVIDYAIQSLGSAETTDEGTLDALYPEFGTRFKRDFCNGQSLLISGLRAISKDDLESSSELDRAWKDWYNTNRKQIENAFNAALQ